MINVKHCEPVCDSTLIILVTDRHLEALLLLTALTPASPDLQKLVAFENAFDRIFAIIESEGSLTNGGVVVQDCLSLLANLLRLNASNQSFFRETGGVAKIAHTLVQALKEEASQDGINEWNRPQRDKNLWGFLSVVRLFLIGGSVGTQMNQGIFWQNGVVTQILEIAFHPTLPAPIRSEALLACADLIRGNESIQEKFSQRNVTFHVDVPQTPATPAAPKAHGQPKGSSSTPVTVNVIQGLLDLGLAVSCSQPFDVRLAATECIKASLLGHGAFRLHFLQHARDGHESDQIQPDNVFSILLDDDQQAPGDIWRPWIASVILFHLIHENYDAKQIAMGIAEGDASKGEEVVTCIQALSANLISKAQKADDNRVVIGYLMVLSSWLYEDMDAVNDFLQEGSSIQALIQIVLSPGQQKPLEAGLCAFLLGIIYEFSSKDSPIPRSKLHEILTSRLGRDYFTHKMTKLREHPYVRDFEVLGQGAYDLDPTGQPMVYFDKTFIDFLKDNFSRVYRAFDRDPNIEVSVVANGIQKGISRELVDSLKAQLDEKTQALQKVESEKLTLEQRLGQEQAEHRRSKESANLDLSRLKAINESLQRGHEEDLAKVNNQHATALANASTATDTLRTQHKQQLAHLEATHKAQITETAASVGKTVASIQTQMKRMKDDAEAMAAKIRTRHEEELADLRAELARHQKALEKAGKDHAQDLSTAHEEYQAEKTTLENRVKRAEDRSGEADNRAKDALQKAKEMEGKADEANRLVELKEQARQKVQSELEDLLMVLGDLEEKRTADKVIYRAA